MVANCISTMNKTFDIFFSLSQKSVILGDKANLEAKGANGVKGGSGGGGGVIAIFFNQGLVGETPVANESTQGGEGAVPGDNGVVVINGMFGSMMNTANKMTVKQFHILQDLTSVFTVVFLRSLALFMFVCLSYRYVRLN